MEAILVMAFQRCGPFAACLASIKDMIESGWIGRISIHALELFERSRVGNHRFEYRCEFPMSGFPSVRRHLLAQV